MKAISKSVVAMALVSPIAANAVTSGSCSSSSTGSVTLSEAAVQPIQPIGFVATGTPSFSTTDSEASGACFTSGGASLSGSANGLFSSIQVVAASTSQVQTSGTTLTLSGAGELSAQNVFAYNGQQSVSASYSGATTMEQSFVLSPGEEVNYGFNLALSGNSATNGYELDFDPSISIALSSGSGSPISFSSGYPLLGSGSNPSDEMTAFTGQIVNETSGIATYTLTASVNSPVYSDGTGNGEHYAGNIDDEDSYQYSLALTPVSAGAPEIDLSSGQSGLVLLVGGLIAFRARKPQTAPLR